jgi:type I restriction enzyme S subunit
MRVAMPKVNREALGDCSLWFPGLNEQRDILGFINRETLPFDLAIQRTRRETELIHEYRTRLTADVVTGKLDVREAAAKLPDEVDATPSDEEDPVADLEEAGDEELAALSEEIDA